MSSGRRKLHFRRPEVRLVVATRLPSQQWPHGRLQLVSLVCDGAHGVPESHEQMKWCHGAAGMHSRSCRAQLCHHPTGTPLTLGVHVYCCAGMGIQPEPFGPTRAGRVRGRRLLHICCWRCTGVFALCKRTLHDAAVCRACLMPGAAGALKRGVLLLTNKYMWSVTARSL